jgi:hypothetical protein
MKHLVIELNKKLMNVHKRFLENECKTVEKTLGKHVSPLEFLQMLTQSQDFVWLKPFSALILDIDELTDEKDELNQEDVDKIKKKWISFCLKQRQLSRPVIAIT